MSKIILETPVKGIRGKVSKNDNSYFAMRNGQTILTKVYSPYDGGNTESQQAARVKFARVQARVSEILADASQLAAWTAKFNAQSKYSTLRSFVFANIYKETD